LVITDKWGNFKPSQPPQRVGEWTKSGHHDDDLDTPSQVGPLQTVTVGPNQAVTASQSIELKEFNPILAQFSANRMSNE
jgi:hypothetical protein